MRRRRNAWMVAPSNPCPTYSGGGVGGAVLGYVENLATFSVTPDGDLVVCHGDQDVQRWNGFTATLPDAGVLGPSTAVTVAASGSGGIYGSIRAFCRFLDSDGRVSNVSPVSTQLTIAINEFSITAATNADPISCTATGHPLSTDDTVLIAGVRGNYAANGVWVVTKSDANTFTLNNSTGSGLYTGGGTVYSGASSITYSDIPVPTTGAGSRKQILRSKDGNQNVFYVDLDSGDVGDFSVASISASSTKVESQLGAAVPLLDANGNDLNFTRHGVPPLWKRVSVHHYNRMFYGVDGVVSHGAVSVTNGQELVQGIGTLWTRDIIGWEFYIRGSNQIYSVTDLDVDNQTITVSGLFAGTTNPYAAYEIRKNSGERRKIYYSEANLPFSVNISEGGLELPEDPSAGELTALVPFRNVLYLAFENRTYKLTFSRNPGEDGEVSFEYWRGCINERCWVIVESSLYMLDSAGVHVVGSSDGLSVPIQGLFGLEEVFSINWEWSKYFHVAHDPKDEVIRWFVTLGSGHRYPHHAICYHYRHKRWWVEEFPFPITSSAKGKLDGRPQLYLGSTARRVFAFNHGHLDGVVAGTTRGTVTGSGILSLTDSSSAFDSVVGYPVRITSGTGRGQSNTIAAATGTQLTVKNPWKIKPAVGDTYQIGGINYTWRSGEYDLIKTSGYQKRGVELEYDPTDSASHMEFRVYVEDLDYGITVPVTQKVTETSNGVTTTDGVASIEVDTTRANGFVQHHYDATGAIRSDAPGSVQVEIEGTTNGEQHEFTSINLTGAG